MDTNTAPKKRVFSGVQPSGQITIGNYLGALKNWVGLQKEYDCIFCVVDLHSITVRQDPAQLRRRTRELLAMYLACGIDDPNNIFFVQSHVPAHAELAWVLNCYTMFGELSRMTQFKEKSAAHSDNVNAGLFTYPVLMAADILLYKTDIVPVGVDQKQHIEITRDIAERFNGIYGDVFTVPEAYIPEVGRKIISLTEPEKKMSKSDTSGGSISMFDDRDTIIRRIKRAVTDSGSEVRYAEGKHGINNLMTIYSCFTGSSFEQIEKEFDGLGYGSFKEAVGFAVADGVGRIQEKYKAYLDDRDYLDNLMKDGAARAARIAQRTLDKVYKKVGFYRP